MSRETLHLSDAELLSFLDGEISVNQAMQRRMHLATCSQCCARQSYLESTSVEFAHLYQAVPDQSRTYAASRALLEARLNTVPHNRWFHRITPTAMSHRAYLAAAMLILVVGISTLARQLQNPANTSFTAQIVPNSRLTPGATQPVRLADLCDRDDADQDPAVPPSLQKAVFQEYGLDHAPIRNYQVDYLINPQLGGTSDIRNLWPQPYQATTWNAHAKDALENRLHQMVCNQQIDLASAQQQIASDWIAAYKKYFHTSYPLS